MSKLEVGDICVTQNSRAALLNNGLLVEIFAINPAGNGGSAAPYLIRRVDGHRIPLTICSFSGVLRFFPDGTTWASAHQLRRVDPDDTSSCVEKTERVTEHA